MFFSDEVRSTTNDFPNVPDDAALTERELSMANLLIESMVTAWDPERFHDSHREKIEALIEEKRQGKTILTDSDTAPRAKIVDLMEALNASVAAAAKSCPAKSATPSVKRPAATKVAAKPRTAAKKVAKEPARPSRAKPAARKAS
jgi:DNA end-binding protein Ku